MRKSCQALGWMAVVWIGLAGCVSERDELAKERDVLETQRQGVYDQMNRDPHADRWRSDPRVQDGVRPINDRIGEIDRKLGR